ncbi:type II toxin-antitoxin system RelE/ParE family toxin [Rhodoferax sp. 4810]|nr:type II toxin-antitoxin system RelE/ParE family toxin [Rhodoferax jenense]
MNELVFARQALADLQRLTDFLLESDPHAAHKTVAVIFDALQVLEHSPDIGRKVRSGMRELVISRGRTGYLALYRFFPIQQKVLVLALRHQREAGYTST